MVISIVLPTFNRSAKLIRIINAYSRWVNPPEIFVLDASKNEHLELNKKNLLNYKNIHHIICDSREGFSVRLYNWILKDTTPEIFFIGNDEDLFLEKFATYASNELTKNKQLSTVIGSYITCLKPLFRVIPQISFRRTIFTPFLIKGQLKEKIYTFWQQNTTAKLPPIFYGPRRKSHLILDLKKIIELDMEESTEELADQLYLLKSGDILFKDLPMLIRDETRVKYHVELTRMNAETYCSSKSLKNLSKTFFPSQPDVFLSIYTTFFPALISNNEKIKPYHLLHSYLTSMDTSSLDKNKFRKYILRYILLIMRRTGYFLNSFISIIVLSNYGKSLIFLTQLILNPIKVNQLYRLKRYTTKNESIQIR